MKKGIWRLINSPVLVVSLTIIFIGVSMTLRANAQTPQNPPSSEKNVYKELDGVRLEIWIWKPAGWKETDKRSAIIFYHGGGWRAGSPVMFSRQCAKLAERGMVAFSAQYRLTSQQGIKIEDCVQDAKSAFRWVKIHAADMGVDPAKIAAGGGSAGGHLATALVTLDDINDPADDASVKTAPAALVLFNPAVRLDLNIAKKVTSRSMEDLLKLSPYHHLKAGHPPTIIFHGDADTTVPIQTVQDYAAKVKKLGGQCDVIVTRGQQHSFFNKEPFVWDTLKQTQTFLEKEGLLNKSDQGGIGSL